jgi:soluble lytic murein transglycosylase-like protein
MIDPQYVNYARKWASAWSKAYGVTVPAELVVAIIAVESSGNPKAKLLEANGQWSRGLMQVQEPTAAQMGYRNVNLHDAETGVEVGTKYLAWQIRRYRGNLRDAVAAYNAGTMRKGSSGNYINQAYVDKVFSRFKGTIASSPAIAGLLVAAIAVASMMRARITKGNVA